MFFPSKIPHWGGAEQSWGKKKRGVWAGFMGCVPQMGKAVPHCNGNSIWGGSGRDLLREFPSSRMGGAAGPGGGGGGGVCAPHPSSWLPASAHPRAMGGAAPAPFIIICGQVKCAGNSCCALLSAGGARGDGEGGRGLGAALCVPPPWACVGDGGALEGGIGGEGSMG